MPPDPVKTSEAYAEYGPPARPAGAPASRRMPSPRILSALAPAEPLGWRAALDRLYPANTINFTDRSWSWLLRNHPAIAAEVRSACDNS